MTSTHGGTSRRSFLKQTTGVAMGGPMLASALASRAHAAADDTLRVALVGCGGRGTGAAQQALSTAGPVKLVAMADAFRDRLDGSLAQIEKRMGDKQDRVDVPEERRFTGFDAYKKAIDAGADVVILTTPPGFRPEQFEYAIDQGKHVFMEKPVAVDGPGVRRVIEAGRKAKEKNLKVGVGLQRHHEAKYLETVKRIQDGAIGDLTCCARTGTAPASGCARASPA